MNQRLITRDATKTEATTRVTVVTTKTAGPRSGVWTSALRFGSAMVSVIVTLSAVPQYE